MSNLFIEKYRPGKFEDVVGQEVIIERIKAMVKQENVPHMLFAGPSGPGKTTLSLIIAKTLFKDNWKENFLEMNASSERGIDIIRNEVKNFSKTRPIGNNLPKIIFLDEADALTKEAQNALRRTMEQFSDNARFILSCNYVSKIIDPIQSRCAIFKFRPLTKDNIRKIVDVLAKNEKLKIDDNAFNALYEISDGD